MSADFISPRCNESVVLGTASRVPGIPSDMLKTLLNILLLSGHGCRACAKPIVAADVFGASEGVCAACVADPNIANEDSW